MNSNNLREKILEYYRGLMPYCDKTDVPEEVLEDYASHACFLRENVGWCRELPEDIFLENVAAYRVNSERVEPCRKWFYDLVMPLIEGLSLREAIVRVNVWCACQATYHQADFRTANAVTVYKSGFGRCGEESTFAVSVLRSVGIAAQQVYVPLWSHSDDNHAWCEVYCDGKWNYIGACEPDSCLNRGWFASPASRAMLLHTRSFGLIDNPRGITNRSGSVIYRNVTDHYADAADLCLRLLTPEGDVIRGEKVSLEILNYGRFGRISELETDGDGYVRARLGLGSVRIACVVGGRYLSGIYTSTGGYTGDYMLSAVVYDEWVENYLRTPVGREIRNPESDRAMDAEKYSSLMKNAGREREERIASYYDAGRAEKYPDAAELLRKSGGNFDEVITFLEKDGNPYRLKLLGSLTEKDWYDLRADILEEHLEYSLPYRDDYPEDVFVNYVLCPRAEFEELSLYRAEILSLLGGRADELRANPALIWDGYCRDLREPVDDAYPTLRMLPVSSLKSGVGAVQDKKNLFIAICRTLGIPARMNRMTREPEYYINGEFMPVQRKAEAEKTRLTLKSMSGELKYGADWTISMFNGREYELRGLHREKWENSGLSVMLENGEYRIITRVRLSSGDQIERELTFILDGGERVIEIEKPHERYDEKKLPLPEVEVVYNGESATLNGLRGGKRAAYIWIREGEEPTEHILNELIESANDAKPYASEIFLLSEKAPKESGVLSRLLSVLDIRLILSSDFDSAEKCARAMKAEAKYPLVISVDESGSGIYSTSGYSIGSAEQILKRMRG